MNTIDPNVLRNVLERIALIDPSMPLSHVQAFVWIAMNEGKHQIELERYLGMSNATASRVLNSWGEWKRFRDKRKGPGYIEQFPDPNDRRYRVMGRAFWQQLIGKEDADGGSETRNTLAG